MSLSVELVFGSTQVGGTERQVLELADRLRGHVSAVRVVVLNNNGPLSQELDARGIDWAEVGFTGISMSRVPFVPTRNTLRSLGNGVRFRFEHTRTGAADISHAFLDGAVLVAPMVTRRRGGRPLRVAGVRGSRPPGHTDSRLYPHALRSADLVVCNARHLSVEVVDEFGVDPGRVRVVPNGVELPDWVADPGVEPPRGVVVANFQLYKGYDVLLEALARVEVPLVVHLCGGGDRSWFVDRAAELGVSERVVFVDQPADVPAELGAAQFAVHPSRTEGLSNAVLEEMAAGLPVVASDVGGLPTLVEHGVNGLLVPPGDPVALAEALTRMVVDRGMREKMGAAARERAESFSWAACVQAHVDLYEELLEQHR